MKEYKWIVLLNIVIMVVYAIVAIYFEKWWIVLLSAFSLFTYRSKDDDSGND